MKKILTTLTFVSLILAGIVYIMPSVAAVAEGSGVNITINVTLPVIPPKVFICDHRVVTDDNTAPGRNRTSELIERMNNYAFEGEMVQWLTLVIDQNGASSISNVFVNITGNSSNPGNGMQVSCQQFFASNSTFDVNVSANGPINASCNAQINNNNVTQFDPNTMAYYLCKFTVEPSNLMYGQHYIRGAASDSSGATGVANPSEFWFFNPIIGLGVSNNIAFNSVTPGSTAYSNTINVGNSADFGSGVMLDMFISGTDFYDSSGSGAQCPTTNQLSLSNFRYFATHGAYSTFTDAQNDLVGGLVRNRDVEGYVNIDYGTSFNNPNPFYDNMEIIQVPMKNAFGYYPANLLSPGDEISLTFKLNLPSPCIGNFDSGNIFFWGETV